MKSWACLILVFCIVFAIASVGYTQDLLLPSLASPRPSEKEETLPSLDLAPTPKEKEELPTLDVSPASPSPGTQNPVTIFQPPKKEGEGIIPQTWKKYNIRELVGINDPVARGVIEYPENWQVVPDAFNRRVIFQEDQNGSVALVLFVLSYVQYPTATDYIAAIIQMLSGSVANLRVTKQDEQNVTNPAIAGYGANATIAIYELSGNLAGQEMIFGLEASVFSLYDSSTGQAALYWAPASLYPEKQKTYFNRMLTSYKNSLR